MRALFTSTGLAAALLLGACGDDPVAPDLSVEAAGPHVVGTSRFDIDDDARARALSVQVWYPAVESARADADAGFGVADFESDAGRAETFADLHDAAPAGCPTTSAHAAVDAPVADGLFPLVLFSHCHECTRFSSFTVAERLASHGFVVVAVEHTGNTLYEWQAGTGVAIDTDFLAVRAADVGVAIDEVIAGAGPDGLTGAIDGELIGVFGHSFGAVTAGLVAQEDGRIDAAFGIAAPMDNPLLPAVEIAALEMPLGFLVAVEDNSITELGNMFLRDNFAEAPGPAWKVEVADAGHWSFSDLVGIEPFPAGCGDGVRQTTDAPFTYLPPATGRAIAAAHVTAFFRGTLADDAGAVAYVEAGRPDDLVTALARPDP